MDDMTVFEGQVAGELVRRAGPVRPVDDAAILAAVTAAATSRRRLPSMLSATRLVVAGSIVALFGGFLAAGLLSRPGDVAQAPAATSPSPAASDGPLAGMIVEEVEPGVVRIVDDGAGHDLDEQHPTMRYDMDDIVVAADGTVWLRSSYSGTDNDAHPSEGPLLWVLGRPGVIDLQDGHEGDLVPLADGSILIIGDRISRFVTLPGGQDLSFGADEPQHLGDGATLWLLDPDDLMGLVEDGESVARPSQHLAVVEYAGQWMSPFEFGHRTENGELGRCSASYDGIRCRHRTFGEGRAYLEGTQINQIAFAPDGALWAVGGHAGENGGLYRITPD